ncbi:hypothetical protein EHV15_10530 [Paenibacillus oralis]|uniref:Uncharacterized protein n=1 Tax=Paenibacillus oralis TaxID=2490856 RepID=A0A3P3U143_9BACL|nr:hypothetical protein [Paenibacillus oralis]RRJ63308.1 hypothetical protein EHV15_10530 [Paenibacillus oralis]
MNILTKGVMQGLIGASGHMKMADVAMGVYKTNHNDGALGYAMDSMNRAAESSPEVGEALKQAQAEAKKQAKAEQEASLEKVRRQKAAEAKEENRAPAASPPADTIEIGAEGRKFCTKLFNESGAQHAGTAKAVMSEPKLYSPQGDIKVMESVLT